MPCDNVDLEELDIDMEELESRLYSQIYHSMTESADENSVVCTDPPTQDNFSKGKPTQGTLKTVNVELTARSNNLTSNFSNVSRDNRVDSFQQGQAEYISIETNAPRKSKNEKQLRRREIRRLKRQRERDNRRSAQREYERSFNLPKQVVVVDEIVVISDDEVCEVPLNETKEESSPKRFKSDEAIVEAPNDESSDDENDVILVEVPNVVITIDDEKEDVGSSECDSESESEPDLDATLSITDLQLSVEGTVSPQARIRSNNLLTKVPSGDFEEAELLSIPESNSNDFLENVNLNRPDVLDNELDLSTATAGDNVSYVCDYDSQSSTNSSESTSPASKTNFLFNTPQRELNLDSFTSYMASKSAFTPDAPGDDAAALRTPKSAKQSHISINDFDTSSESEYDYVVKKSRNSESDVQDAPFEISSADNVHLAPVLDVWAITSDDEDDPTEDISIVELLNVGKEKKINKSVSVKKEVKKNENPSIIGREKEVNKSVAEKKEVYKKIEVDKKDKKSDKEVKRSSTFSDFWTEDMEKFYRQSWGQENYDVDEVKRTMPDDPSKWKINHADQGGIFKTPQGKRCHLCRDFGHRAFRCPRKNYQPCILCGSKSHLENNCTRSLCTTCGRPSRSQTNWCMRCNLLKEVKCKICYFRGHEENRCPDLWRRYLFTTAEGPIQKIPDTTIKPSKDMWCCGCASSGHYQFDCRKRFNPYSSTSTRIHEFKEVYNFSTHQTTKPAAVQMDSSLSNKENDTCNAINTLNNVRQHVKLSAKESEKLTRREGFEFLAQINRSTGLKFKVMTQNFKHSTRKYFCIIEGHPSFITDAKFAIKNYCGGKSLSEVIHRKLNELDRPYKKWYHHGKALYNSIQKAEKSSLKKNLILKQCKLGAKYSALNMILIGKLLILDGRKHMDNLRKFDADRTGKLLSNDVRTSFDYVFNKCERLKVDYRRLIDDLPRFSFQHRKTMVKGTYKTCLVYCSKRKMFTKINNLNKLWKNVLDSKFSEDVVNKFCQFCSTIIVVSPKKNKKS